MTRPGGNLFAVNRYPQGHPAEVMGGQPNRMGPYQEFPVINRSPYNGGPQSSQLSQRSSIHSQMFSSPFAKQTPMGPQSMSPSTNIFGSKPGPYEGMQKSLFQPQMSPFQNQMPSNNSSMQPNFNGARQNPFVNPMNMRPPNMMPPNMMNSNMMNANMMNANMMNANMMNANMMNANMMMMYSKMTPAMMQPGMMNPNMMHPGMMPQNMMMANMMRAQMVANSYQRQMIHKIREDQRKQQEEEDQEENEALDRVVNELEKQQDALQDIAASVSQDFDDYRNQRRENLERKYMKQKLTKSINESRDLSAHQRSTTYEDDSYAAKKLRNSSLDTVRGKSSRDWLYSQESSRSNSREFDRDYGGNGSSQQRSNHREDSDYYLQQSPYLGKKYSSQLDIPTRNYNGSRYTPRELHSSNNYYDATEEIDEEESVDGSPIAKPRHHEEEDHYIRNNDLDSANDQEEQTQEYYEEEPQTERLSRPQFESVRSNRGLFDFKKRVEYASSNVGLMSLSKTSPRENIVAMHRSKDSNFDESQSQHSAREIPRKKPTIVPNVRGTFRQESQSATIPIRNREEIHQFANEEVEEEQNQSQEERENQQQENLHLEEEGQKKLNEAQKELQVKENEDEIQKQEDVVIETQIEEEQQDPEEPEVKEEQEEEKPTLFNIKSRTKKKKGNKKKKKNIIKAEKPTEEQQQQQEVVQSQPQEDRPAPPKTKSKPIIPQDEQLMNAWNVPSLKKEPDPSLRVKPLPPLSKVTTLSNIHSPRKEQLPEIKEEPQKTIPSIKNEQKRTVREVKPKKEEPRVEETKQVETTINKEEPSQDAALPDSSLQQSANFSKIKSVALDKKPYANIPTVNVPQSRRVEKQDTQISISNVDNPNSETTIVRRNVRLGTIDQKRGLFSYSKK